ncbi:hypothetical protein CALCODRAFT_485779 [Calocera cornea HHB12733]|uniref:Uncharacterized protein n=1 Tax=Calocera cornea HHB12733 TaxID=1353952 RepID=A0A165E678_9BASI|nr:hypothetical protein CALCODRAFT_485779 [Calocera cornea HHB12733]
MIVHPLPPAAPAPTAPYFHHLAHHLSQHIARITAARPHTVLPTLASLDAHHRKLDLHVRFHDTAEHWVARLWFTHEHWVWLTHGGTGLPSAVPHTPPARAASTSPSHLSSSSHSLSPQHLERAAEEHFTHTRLALLACTTGYPLVWGAVLTPPDGLPAALFLSAQGTASPVGPRWGRATREQRGKVLQQLARARAEALRGALKAQQWYALHAPREMAHYNAAAWFARRLQRRMDRVRQGRGEGWEDLVGLERLRDGVQGVLRRFGDGAGEDERGTGLTVSVAEWGVPMLAHPVLSGETVWATEDWDLSCVTLPPSLPLRGAGLQVTDKLPTPLPACMLLTMPALLCPTPAPSPTATASHARPARPLRPPALTRFPFSRAPSFPGPGRGRAQRAKDARPPQGDVRGEALWDRQVYVHALLDELRAMRLLAQGAASPPGEPGDAANAPAVAPASPLAEGERRTQSLQAQEQEQEKERETEAPDQLPAEETWSISGVYHSRGSPPPQPVSPASPRAPAPASPSDARRAPATPHPPSPCPRPTPTPTPQPQLQLQLQESDIRTLLGDTYAAAAFLAAAGVGGKAAWDSWERAMREREEERAAARRFRAGEGRTLAAGFGFAQAEAGGAAGKGLCEVPGERRTRSDWSFCAPARAEEGRLSTPGGASVLEQEEEWGEGGAEGGGAGEGEDALEEEEEDEMEWAERESGWHTPVGGAADLVEKEGVDLQDSVLDEHRSEAGAIPQVDPIPDTPSASALAPAAEGASAASYRTASSLVPSFSPELAELRRIRAALFPDSADTSLDGDADPYPPLPDMRDTAPPELTFSPRTQSGVLSPSTSWPSDALPLPPARAGAVRRKEAQKSAAIPDFLLTLPSDGGRTSFLEMDGGEHAVDSASQRARARLEEWQRDERFGRPESRNDRAPSTTSVVRPLLLPRTYEEYTSDSDAADDVFGPAHPQAFPMRSRTSLPQVEQPRESSRTRTDARATYPAYPAHLHPNAQAEDSDLEVFYSPQPSLRPPTALQGSRTPSPRHSPYPAHLHPAAAQESDLYGGTLNAPDQSDRTSMVSTSSSLSSLGTLVGPTSEAFIIDRWDMPTPTPESYGFAREVRSNTPEPAPSPRRSVSTSRAPSRASTASGRTSRIRRVPVPAYIPELESGAETEGTHTDEQRREEMQDATPDLSMSSPLAEEQHGFDSTSPTTPSSANDEQIFESHTSSPSSGKIGGIRDMRFQLAVDAPSRPSLEKRIVPSAPIHIEERESIKQKSKRVWGGIRVPSVREMVRRAT